MTITTHRGTKVRCTSKRRFFVIVERTRDGEPVGITVTKRTDDIAVARAEISRKGSVETDGADRWDRFIFDSARGEFTR